MKLSLILCSLILIFGFGCSKTGSDNTFGNDETTDSSLAPPSLRSLENQSYTQGLAIDELRIADEDGGEIASCQVTPDLPSGLSVVVSIDSEACIVSGIPTETKDETNYTFLATNAGGSSEIILVIAVNEPEFTEQINLTYESSDTIRIGLAVSSGLVRLDWNDGSPPVDISNTSIDHIFAYDAPRVHLREGTSTSSAHAVTLSFTDGVDSLIGFLSRSSYFPSQIELDELATAKNLVSLWCGSECESYVTLSNLSASHPNLRKLHLVADLPGDIKHAPRTLLELDTTNSLLIGNIDDIPKSIEKFEFNGKGETGLVGDVKNLPENLVAFTLAGQSRAGITGDMGNIPRSIREFHVNGEGDTLYGDIKNLPAEIRRFSVLGGNTISGSVRDLPSSLWEFSLQGENSLTGEIKDIPISIESFSVHGNNSLSGSIKDLSSSIRHFTVDGKNSISGDIGSIKELLYTLDLNGNNTVSGIVKNLPYSLGRFHLGGKNTVTGDVVDIPGGVDIFHLHGYNTLSGDIGRIPSSIREFYLSGKNTVRGDIMEIPVSLEELSLGGENTVNGNVMNVPASLWELDIQGKNTMNGDVGLLQQDDLRKFRVGGLNTISFSGTATWNPNQLKYFSLTGTGAGFDSETMDQLLEHLSSSLGRLSAPGEIEILRSGDAPRTPSSNGAVSALESKGYIVTTKSSDIGSPISMEDLQGVWTYDPPKVGEYYFVFKDGELSEYDYHGDILDGDVDCYAASTTNFESLGSGRYLFENIKDDLSDEPKEYTILLNSEGRMVWALGNMILSEKTESDFVPACDIE